MKGVKAVALVLLGLASTSIGVIVAGTWIAFDQLSNIPGTVLVGVISLVLILVGAKAVLVSLRIVNSI